MGVSVYADDAAAALELLTEFGQTMTVTRTIAGARATPVGPFTTPTVIVATVIGVVLPFKTKRAAADTFEPGFNIQESARTVIIAGTAIAYVVTGPESFTGDFKPQPGDVVAAEGANWKVVGNSAVAPDGLTPIIHDMTVRK